MKITKISDLPEPTIEMKAIINAWFRPYIVNGRLFLNVEDIDNEFEKNKLMA
jgi:hypothetical protein